MEPDPTTSPLRVAVIIGSTRQGRAGEAVATWFAAQAEQRDDVKLSVIDLVDFDFPARYPDQPTPAMTEFAARVAEADAFVVVTPEYNHSFPAALKQAIDCAYDEWRAKPVGFVAYGCGSEGVYAVEQLRVVFTELHAMSIRNWVGLNLMSTGGIEAADGRPVATMLDQLVWWGLALREARTARPYVC